MDYKLVWSPEAIDDLESIAEYINRDSTFYTQAVVTKIIEITRNIKCFPLAGRIVPELGDNKVRGTFCLQLSCGLSDRRPDNSYCRSNPR